VKASIWTIIKDNFGKDLSSIGVPVYFNDPTNLLQKSAQSAEYNSAMLSLAAAEKDPVRRMALVMCCCITHTAPCATTATKPFNPLLGETFEYENADMVFLAE